MCVLQHLCEVIKAASLLLPASSDGDMGVWIDSVTSWPPVINERINMNGDLLKSFYKLLRHLK